MKNIIIHLFIAYLSIIFLGCSNEEQNVGSDNCFPKGKVVKIIEDEKGMVFYNSDFDKWIIVTAVPGTYDSQNLGIVCDEMPVDFQTSGIFVTYSGTYTERENTKGPYPGQTYYNLYLEDIALVDLK